MAVASGTRHAYDFLLAPTALGSQEDGPAIFGEGDMALLGVDGHHANVARVVVGGMSKVRAVGCELFLRTVDSHGCCASLLLSVCYAGASTAWVWSAHSHLNPWLQHVRCVCVSLLSFTQLLSFSMHGPSRIA